MIEKAPKNPNVQESVIVSNAFQILMNTEYASAISKINEEYLYWDKVKYHVPKDLDAQEFWMAVKFSRKYQARPFTFPSCTFFLKETPAMQEALHQFDMMNSGGALASSSIPNDRNRQYYLISSIMEEAIASSQMEGASTTRKVAKEMLFKQTKPKDKSQRMILNNYNTIRFLSEHKDDNLTPELILEIHRQISEKTLDDSAYEGRFRTDDSILVMNDITGEVAHNPPSHTVIQETIEQLCRFANEDETFIHPVVKAIIIHFMISHLHPFMDGNGRTARSLFYWYMLKKGYWLTEYLSISRIIYKNKNKYEKAFLYTEYDDYDLGYFVQYNLKVLEQAFEELKTYLDRKSKESNALLEYRIPGLNERQMQIVKMCVDRPSDVYTCKELETRFNVTAKTIRSDLEGLVKFGLMETIELNKRLTGYMRSNTFESTLKAIRGN